MARKIQKLYGKKATTEDIALEIQNLLYAKSNRPYPLKPAEIAKSLGLCKKTVYNYISKLTNYRVIYGNNKTDEFTQVPLKYVDVVVMNSHSTFQSTGIGYGGAMPGSLTLGVGVMNRRGVSQRIGDLVFVLEGQIVLEFTNVADPTGIKSLINQVKKQMNSKSTKKIKKFNH